MNRRDLITAALAAFALRTGFARTAITITADAEPIFWLDPDIALHFGEPGDRVLWDGVELIVKHYPVSPDFER